MSADGGAGVADDAELKPVAAGVWAWIQGDGTWWVNNAGLIAGDEGDIIVDTCATDRRTAAFLRAIERARGQLDVRFAVNTHLHGDHTYGNSLLPDATSIVGHRAMRAGLAEDPIIDGCPPVWSPVPDWGAVSKRLPTITYASQLTLHSGDRAVELHHPGYPAHTPGDTVAWLPDERVLFTGDLLFHGLTPLVFMGSVDGALDVLDWISEFGAEYIVPGHGPMITAGQLPNVLAQHERYYRFVLHVARQAQSSGHSPLEAAREADLGEFAAWADAERLVLNLHRAYADAQGSDIDIMAAFEDALTYHGGPLPTQV